MKQNSTRRSRRHRNPHTQDGEQQAPFFSKESSKSDSKNAFFQPKLTIGQSGDQYEQEADSMADAVVNGSNDTPAVQKKAKGIQKMDSSKMEEDRAIQEKSMIQRMEGGEEEEPVQMQSKEEEASVQMVGEQEEEPIQKMEGEEEEAVQMQAEEEEPVQMMQGEEEETAQMKEEEESIQTKSDTAKNAASPKLSQRIKSRSGGGKTMSDPVRAEMEQAFGTDFSGVNIHTDTDAVQMNKTLGAQAFTHGRDIYFNSGKYNPENSQGKHLLAHELTHVVQQGASSKKNIQKQDGNSDSRPRRRWRPVVATQQLVNRLLRPSSPLWRQLNPDASSQINCPAAAAAVDHYLRTGEVNPAEAGDGGSTFIFNTRPWSEATTNFNEIRQLLTTQNSFVVVQANRSSEYLQENPNITSQHYFVALKDERGIIGLDAFGRGYVHRDLDQFIQREGFSTFRYYRGEFVVEHQQQLPDSDSNDPLEGLDDL